MADLTLDDIPRLMREIENAEGDDELLHQWWNNVGIAYKNGRKFKESLNAHREEKHACQRLRDKDENNVPLVVELSIAYRQVGDAIANVDSLKLAGETILDDKVSILDQALDEHYKALGLAEKALEIDPKYVRASVEVQASLSNIGRTYGDQGHITKDEVLLDRALGYSMAASAHAHHLPKSISKKERQRKVSLAAINQAVVLNELGMYAEAVELLKSIAVKMDEDQNYIRAMANLVDSYLGLSDQENASRYALKWAVRAEDTGENHEEATARLKLANILSKLNKFAEARDALKRALFLHTDKETRKNIRELLATAELNLETDARESEQLKNFEDQLAVARTPREEAELRYEVGTLCFNLRRHPKCVEHLERLMKLMDEHKMECSPEKLDMTKELHGRMVANLAEACWKCGQNESAVKWGQRELLVYGDDKAGQAQAWGNLGIYLSELDPEKGIEALEKAIALGEVCGEKEIVGTARKNLDIEREKQKKKLEKSLRKQSSTQIPCDVPGDVINVDNKTVPDNAEVRLPRIMANIKEGKTRRGSQTDEDALSRDPTPTKRRPQLPEEEKSIVLCSGQDMSIPGPAGEYSMAVSRSGPDGSRAASSAVYSVSRPLSRGGDSLGRSTVSGIGARSGVVGGSTTTRYKNLVDAYEQLCSSTSARGPREREEIRKVLNKVSTSSFVEKECTLKVNLDGYFLKENELRPIVLSISSLDKEKTVILNLARNRLLSESSFTVLLEQQAPRTIIELDLTGTGVNVRILSVLTRAVGKDGNLASLMKLNLSKNALGRAGVDAADACADLLVRSRKLIEFDLTWNALPSTFLPRFVKRIREADTNPCPNSTNSCTISCSWLHLKLNNVRNPDALLEFKDAQEAVQCFFELFRVAPLLNEIDLRACGANADIRRALYEARSKFQWPIMLVSSNVQDTAAL